MEGGYYLPVALFLPLVGILAFVIMIIVSMYLSRKTRRARERRAARHDRTVQAGQR